MSENKISTRLNEVGRSTNETDSVRIVIFAGGRGSAALQRGLYKALDSALDGIDTQIIVNAYDNGLSTGTVRRVMDGRILGPSDVRKNQAMRLELQDPTSPWIKFLETRFSVTARHAPAFCKQSIYSLGRDLELRGQSISAKDMLLHAVDEYFLSPNALDVDYVDFSLANIVYAGVAKANGYSMQRAATLMASAMGIPDNVLINDDTPLYLGAITRSGQRVTNEAEIVRWGNDLDPFEDVFFVDVNGTAATPILRLDACHRISAADLIILSSGTQWSSLIPTYASAGFGAAISACKGKVVMVMNRTPDTDSPSQSASDIIDNLVPRYFDAGRIHVLVDSNSHPRMREFNRSSITKIASCTLHNLSSASEAFDKHNPSKLVAAIGRVYFSSYLDSNYFLFDYDDTLVGRDGGFPKSSLFNMRGLARLNELVDIGVCTGNSIEAVDINLSRDPLAREPEMDAGCRPLQIFADGGVNRYACNLRFAPSSQNDLPKHLECLVPDAQFPQFGPAAAYRIVEALEDLGVAASTIQNRGNVIIAIRPVSKESRDEMLSLLKRTIHEFGLDVRATGRSTIEICKPVLSKVSALKYLIASRAAPCRISYVGDELDCGIDRDIMEFSKNDPSVACLSVNSPAKTAFFISTLVTVLTENVTR